jgi:D-xylose transport system ATP-binding protein
LRDINITARKGEILGIAGLMGAGRTELVNSVFGDAKGRLSGETYINGKLVAIKTPGDAIKEGLGLVTEDRKFNGLNLIDTIENNVIMPSLKRLSKFGVIDQNESIKQSKEHTDRVKVKAPSLEALVMNLSGGNQQKVIIAKWLMVNPRVLMFDEPTRGIDVGVKYEIYNIMNDLKRNGITIIMISSELPEILGMSDRIIVLRDGMVTGEFENAGLTEEILMQKATWSG